ncbi:EcsC family protein [Rhodococcoides corynebacterioides]|uniref:EcsC family protein n=1 Tax=Rhodococcoides corynebacterioides TaxID=53972 RepID=UPI003F7D67D0
MENDAAPGPMSAYEQKRWGELRQHWEKKAKGRKVILPTRARSTLDSTVRITRGKAREVGRAVSDHTPEGVKYMGNAAVDAALVPTVHNVVRMLELLNDWVVELTDLEAVLDYHRSQGRGVESLADLKSLDLKHLDELTNSMALRWRTIGAAEGALLGSLAMIPVPVLGSAAAIGLDMVAMQALTGAIATRICYSYGFDAKDPANKHVIDRMVARAYKNQMVKAGSVKKAAAAFDAAKGRVNWSARLREDHRLMAAVEKLLRQTSGGKVPVQNARMGMPLIAVFAGAATNAHVLGDTVEQARNYGATLALVEKYGLKLPGNLNHDVGTDDATVEG